MLGKTNITQLPGFSAVVFEFLSPLCKETAHVFTYLEYTKHLP